MLCSLPIPYTKSPMPAQRMAARNRIDQTQLLEIIAKFKHDPLGSDAVLPRSQFAIHCRVSQEKF